MSSDLVRLRICQILHKFLETKCTTHSNVEVEKKINFKMQIYLSERIRDRDLEVQKTALKASFMLQNPKDKYCPIINSLVHILKHESLTEIKLLIIDSIAINNQTYQMLKNELIYDSNKTIRSKVVFIIEKQIPSRLIDSKFKKRLIELLIRDKNYELLEKFLHNWSLNNQQKQSLYELIRSLDLENSWFRNLNDSENFYPPKIF